MVTQIFIDKQGVKRRGIKAGKEHANDNQQIYFLGLNSSGQIAIVILEAVAIHTEVGFKVCIVIVNGCT